MAIKKTVYPHSADTARERGELDKYRESNKINCACAVAIDKAIHDSNYEPFHYDLKAAVEKVTKEYGENRVAWVMAATVQLQHYDGRYSNANKGWACGFDIPYVRQFGDKPRIPYYGTNAHAVLIDGFITHLREQMAQKKERKPSVTGQLKEGAAKLAAAKTEKEPIKKKSEQEIE
ncbi:MAG: DUF3849 domain-containing protein [Oscillospiraceae bacterium]|jgi:hypothetical protein|nr:DUF3849 domain-containing protein [Oscillospiraceae bacterium]